MILDSYYLALSHIRRIMAAATSPRPPITSHEALEQILEELDLVGFGLIEAAVDASAVQADTSVH